MFYVFSFFIVNFNYMFSIVFLGLMVMMVGVVLLSGVMFLKFLIMMVYVSGIVVFVMYMSCLCWSTKKSSSFLVFFFCLFVFYWVDCGSWNVSMSSDVGLWVCVFFGFLFSMLVMVYSLVLFSSSGSLRF